MKVTPVVITPSCAIHWSPQGNIPESSIIIHEIHQKLKAQVQETIWGLAEKKQGQD